MRHRLSVRGISLIEFLGASAIATIVGGSMILLMSGMQQAYQTHLAFQQLSSYLDVASATLKNDIWAATNSCQGPAACPPAPGTDCPHPAGVTTWLALDLPTSGATPTTGWGTGPDVCYVVDQTDATNIKLVRRVWNGAAWSAAWPVAQYIVPPTTPPAGGTSSTTAVVNGGLVTLQLWVRRTINGRTYPRQIINLAYRMQVPS